MKAGGVSTYTVSYTLQGVSESQNSTVKIARGSRIMGPFYEWYIVPEDLYVENVEIAVPEDADFYLDGTRILDQYESEDSDASTGNGEKVYEIPCLFLGYHTARIHEKERTDYREIFYVKNNGHLEFLPELKLNDSTGKGNRRSAGGCGAGFLRCRNEEREFQQNPLLFFQRRTGSEKGRGNV